MMISVSNGSRRELGAKLRRPDARSHDEGPGGADVDDIEVAELPHERCRSKSSVPADVDASQQHDVRHLASDGGMRTSGCASFVHDRAFTAPPCRIHEHGSPTRVDSFQVEGSAPSRNHPPRTG